MNDDEKKREPADAFITVSGSTFPVYDVMFTYKVCGAETTREKIRRVLGCKATACPPDRN